MGDARDNDRWEALRRLQREQQRDARLRAHVDRYLHFTWMRVIWALKSRPGAASCLIWGAIAGAIALDQAAPVVDTPHDAAFLGFLITAVAAIGSWIGGHAVTVVVTIAQAAVMIGTAIANFAIQVGYVVLKVYGLLARFYQHALRPFVSWAWQQVDRLAAWLQRTLGPVLELLETVRAQIDQFYTRWFKPIFDTIDATRRALQLLAQLHVPFARELDAHLARLESRLLWPLQQVYYRLNEAMNWINRIITLDGYLQRLTWVRSQWRYVADSWRALINSRTRSVTNEQREAVRRAWGDRTHADVRRDLYQVLTTGDGPYGPGAREGAAMWEISMRGD